MPDLKTQETTPSLEKKPATGACPCGSKINLSDCCLPIIRGTQPAKTAESLMRARYTAFTLGEVPFILSSHHSKNRDQVKEEEIKEWSLNSKWLGLSILQVDGGLENDTTGAVYFTAKYHTNGEDVDHAEKGIFEKEDGQWKFLDAQGLHLGTYTRTEPKTGRNEPCPCGSGKKYKKCCQLNS